MDSIRPEGRSEYGGQIAVLGGSVTAAIYAPDPFRHGEDRVGVERKSADAAAPARRTRAEEALIRPLTG
jgi:hypothetical protein